MSLKYGVWQNRANGKRERARSMAIILAPYKTGGQQKKVIMNINPADSLYI